MPLNASTSPTTFELIRAMKLTMVISLFIMFFIIYPFWAMPNEEMKKLRNTKRDREVRQG